jgi:endonuclease-3 related protein
MQLMEIFHMLLEHYGSQDWWPVRHDFKPREWEIIIGAILTQNSNWKNTEKALENLSNEGINDARKLLDTGELSGIIRPSGYHNQKARTLKTVAEFFSRFSSIGDFRDNISREDLLGLKGIGMETADSILLYALGKTHFVVDAYTRRIFSRLGILETHDYQRIKDFFEEHVEKDVRTYKEFHALIVRLGKNHCRSKPSCGFCPLGNVCNHKKTGNM